MKTMKGMSMKDYFPDALENNLGIKWCNLM